MNISNSIYEIYFTVDHQETKIPLLGHTVTRNIDLCHDRLLKQDPYLNNINFLYKSLFYS